MYFVVHDDKPFSIRLDQIYFQSNLHSINRIHLYYILSIPWHSICQFFLIKWLSHLLNWYSFNFDCLNNHQFNLTLYLRSNQDHYQNFIIYLKTNNYFLSFYYLWMVQLSHLIDHIHSLSFPMSHHSLSSFWLENNIDLNI